jgi:3-oxoacyl-[acyl-carrier protein] reductase
MNILITGGSSGLGKTTVELLAKESKHQVWFTYYPSEKDIENVDVMIKEFNNVTALKVDFCDVESVENLCFQIEKIDIDVLVNSTYVGFPRTTHFHKIKPKDFLDSFSQNLIPIIKITQAAINIFKQKKYGKIINVLTSYLINLPPVGCSIYIANKSYLQALSKAWNKEYTRFNITSNCILPEYMQTDFGKVDERVVEQMTMDHPFKKLLTTDEVASVIKFLIDASQQINGVNIPINAAQNII